MSVARSNMAQVIVTPQQLAIKIAFEAGVPVQHYDNGGSFLNTYFNRRTKKEKLLSSNNTPTINGKYYYNVLLGIPVPDLFDIQNGVVEGNIQIGGAEHRILGNRGQV
jgi:hypothetical protein